VTQAELLRYVVETLEELEIPYMTGGSPAAVYYREGQSELHLRDVIGILRVSGDEIDSRYVAEWAERLGLGPLWDTVLKRAGQE